MVRAMRKLALAYALLLGFLAQAAAQAPPPVPALPDAPRLTSYNLSGSLCNCSVGFALYGEGTDIDAWLSVYINGVAYLSTDTAHGWTLRSATGPIGNIARPITNATLAFSQPQTGTVVLVGDRRPRRTSQFSEGSGVTARQLNQVITDIIATQRENWDEVNGAIRGQPGEVLLPMAAASARANMLLGFDANGNPLAVANPGGGLATNQPYTWTAPQTFNGGIGQNMPLSGTATAQIVNGFYLSSDATPCLFCADIGVGWNYGGATQRGQRFALFGQTVQTAPNTGPGTTAGAGIQALGQTNTGDGGTVSAPAGTYFGGNFIAACTGFVINCFGTENDLWTDANYGGFYSAAVTATNAAAKQGSKVDAGFLIYSGGQIPAARGGGPWGPGVGFHCGLCFAELSSNKLVPVDVGGTLIGSYWSSLTPPTVAYGVDFGDGVNTGFVFSSAAFRSKGFAVDPNGNVAMASVTANVGNIAAGVLPNGGKAFAVSATQPTAPTAPQNAVDYEITSAGSAVQTNRGIVINYLPGFTGSANSVGIAAFNTAAGIAANLPIAGSNGLSGNLGGQFNSSATTAGDNVGAVNSASGGNLSIGAADLALIPKASAINVGAFGSAANTGSGGNSIGGYFSLGQSTVPALTAAMVADNVATGAPLALFRNNGSTVAEVLPNGSLATLGSIGVGTLTPLAGGATSITVPPNTAMSSVGPGQNLASNLYYNTQWLYAANGVGFNLQLGNTITFFSAPNNTMGAAAPATMSNIADYGVTLTAPLGWSFASNTNIAGNGALLFNGVTALQRNGGTGAITLSSNASTVTLSPANTPALVAGAANVNIPFAGTAAAPAFSFGNATTGLYSASTTGFGISVNGGSVADYGITTGLTQWTFQNTFNLNNNSAGPTLNLRESGTTYGALYADTTQFIVASMSTIPLKFRYNNSTDIADYGATNVGGWNHIVSSTSFLSSTTGANTGGNITLSVTNSGTPGTTSTGAALRAALTGLAQGGVNLQAQGGATPFASITSGSGLPTIQLQPANTTVLTAAAAGVSLNVIPTMPASSGAPLCITAGGVVYKPTSGTAC
jgi:hypothetical protein